MALFKYLLRPQFVRFEYYGMEVEDMNRIMNKYGCPLYDPQVPQRFDGKLNYLQKKV